MYHLWKNTLMPTFSLFTSLGTLVCCALPVLFVTLGAGAALIGLVSSVPWLVTLSEHKVLVFGVAGILLLITGILQYISRRSPCPANAIAARHCNRIKKISSLLFWVSVLIYVIGFFFAFIAVRIFY